MPAGRPRRLQGGVAGIADEGGYWPAFRSNEEAIETLAEAIASAGFEAPAQVAIADVAASSFYRGGAYHLSLEGRTLGRRGLDRPVGGMGDRVPIVSIEDPLDENDDQGFSDITRTLGKRVQIVGDDYLATSARKIVEAGSARAGNTALLKINQCGTVTEFIEAAAAARQLGWNTVQSGRSGESEDVSLSHLAVGLLSDQIEGRLDGLRAHGQVERSAEDRERCRQVP